MPRPCPRRRGPRSATVQITIDAHDPRALSLFWTEVLGYVHPALRGAERMAALEERCAELVALGATRRERHEPEAPTSIGFLVMQDPEGNEFCLD